MVRWHMWAAVAVTVLVAGTTLAQAQRQRPQQPGGGRGGMQQTSLAVTVLTNEDLQKDLKVTDDQKKSLKDVTDKATELAKKRAELFTGGGGRPDQAKMQEIQTESTKLTEEAKTATDKAFTDDQKKRLKQIEVQQLGMRAFTNDDVVKTLKITDDQKTKLKTVTDEYTKASTDLRTEYGMGGGRGAGGGGGNGGARPDAAKMAEYQKKAATLTSESMEKAKKELTDDQKKAFADLTGAAFDLTKLQARPMRRDN